MDNKLEAKTRVEFTKGELEILVKLAWAETIKNPDPAKVSLDNIRLVGKLKRAWMELLKGEENA